ncbi:MAG TPA: type 1 glutamine amidotransferase domain-containing protein [Xanthobacteraceae bacterium]|jgi:putative intracellular protease/amidase|nr:type 1 glutamine amidotransferase domain-containing protein [Xanthobacteraceae bacterium]
MAKARVLMVLTSHDVMGVSGKKTGNWFDEVATPYYKFKEAGFDLTIATPKGGAAPIDPFSYDDLFMTENTHKFLKDDTAQRALANTLIFGGIDVNDYAGVFFPGGYGQIWDLASDSKVIRSIEKWTAEKTPVAMVCHAPAILRDAKKQNGEPLVKGMNVTGFTDAEDDELDLSRHLLFSLERALSLNGANFKRSNGNWSPNVVVDGTLMTGQNPASAAPLADALVARLRKAA